MANYYTEYSQEYTFPTKDAANFFHQLLTIVPQAHSQANQNDGATDMSPEQYKTALETAVTELGVDRDLSIDDRDEIVEFIEKYDDVLEDCCELVENSQVVDDRVWFYNTTGVGSDAMMIANMLQHTQNKFNIEQPYSIEYADLCDRPRTDAFGGGALVITPKKIYHQTTCQWIGDTIKTLTQSPPDTSSTPPLDLLVVNNDGELNIYTNDPSRINQTLVWESTEESGFVAHDVSIDKLPGTAELWQQDVEKMSSENPHFDVRKFMETFVSEHSQ